MNLRLVIKNLFSLSLMRIFTSIFSFALFGLIARMWGPENLGEYSTLFTYFIFIMQLPLLGLHIVVAREISGSPEKLGRYIVSCSAFSIAISLLLGLILIFVGWQGYEAPQMYYSFCVLAFTCIPTAIIVVVESTLIGLEKMSLISRVNVVESLLRTVLSVFLVLFGAPLITLIIVLLGGRLIALFLYISQVKKMFDFTKELLDISVVMSLIKQAPLFFGILLFSVSIGKLDLMFLSLWGNDMEDVGVYSAAFKIYEVGVMVPAIISVVLFPIYSRLYAQNRAEFNAQFTIITRFISALGVPSTVVAFYTAPVFLPLIFGDQYLESVLLFQLLCGAIFCTALDQMFSVILLAAKQEKLEFKVLAITFFVYIASLAFFIPLYGALGAALATLAGLVLKVCVRYYFVRKVFGVSLSSLKLLQILGSGLLMYLVISVVPGRLLAILIGCIAYIIVLLVLKGVTKLDIQLLKTSFSKDVS